MEFPLITLTTDFGEADGYVAQMKGVIYSIAPAARLVDISHAIPPQDIAWGALVLDAAVDAFPPGTIHVAVVDPGVGSDRALLAVEAGEQRFLAPDNGLLAAVLRRHAPKRAARLVEERYRRATVSRTFHGRDILAPAAAHWAKGVDLAEFGPLIDVAPLQTIESLTPAWKGRVLEGSVVSVDRFGNLITNLDAAALASAPHDRLIVQVGALRLEGLSGYYAEQPAGSPVALVGSSGRIEIAIVNGNASQALGVVRGARVWLERAE